jgi:hypothetical protein
MSSKKPVSVKSIYIRRIIEGDIYYFRIFKQLFADLKHHLCNYNFVIGKTDLFYF